jgi:hypothetical protein
MTNRQLTLNEVNTLLNTGSVMTTHGKLTMNVPKSKEDAAEWKRHKKLAGQGISQKDAGAKYGIQVMTIKRWTERGIIRVIGPDENDRRRILLDAQDVAYCAEIHKSRGGGRGHWLFTETGAPYPVTPRRRKTDRK